MAGSDSVERGSATPAVGNGGPRGRTWYSRVLRLRHINPSQGWCLLFFEGTIAVGVLLALTERISWSVVVVLPLAVAVMVKLNDVVAGADARSRRRGRPPSGRA